MSFETREQNGSSQPAEEKPSKASGWAITVVGIVVLAVVVSFPMWGQISTLFGQATQGANGSPATETASDQGITATVESSKVSGATSTIVVRFKDEDGKGRISDKVDFGHYSVQIGTNRPFSTISLRDYDAALGEASYAIAIEGDFAGKRALVDFYSISSGQYNFYVESIDVDIPFCATMRRERSVP